MHNTYFVLEFLIFTNCIIFIKKNLTSCKNELTRQIHLKNETIKQFQGLSHMQSEKELRYQSNLIKSNPTESVNEIYTNGSINNVGSENKFDKTIEKINQVFLEYIKQPDKSIKIVHIIIFINKFINSYC